MEKQCMCGIAFRCKPSVYERTKFCSKVCFYKYRVRPKGLVYVKHKENPTSFKKGSKPWNTGLAPELQPTWKGDKVGYWGLHDWVEKRLGKPRKCEKCGTTNAKKYDWSNKSGNYNREISDWQRLCVSCHFKYDKEKFGTRETFTRW